ncbi:hypothetical protein ACG3SL_00545 [Sphingomonas sp. CJ20]
MPTPYAMRMTMVARRVMCAWLAAISPAGAAVAHPVAPSFDARIELVQNYGQDTARERRMKGELLPVREIERRVIPRMPGAQYLGFDYDPATDIYTLKFLRNGSVIWVDVDGHTGQILRRTGS